MRRVTQERALAILSPLAVLLLWQLASDAGLRAKTALAVCPTPLGRP